MGAPARGAPTGGDDSDHAKCERVYITNITTLELVDFTLYCVGIERVSSNRNISVSMGNFGLKF